MNNQTFAGSELVGRNSELAVTLDLYKRAAAGHGSMLLIRGDGGIGKSRLAAETLSRARLMGAAVMSGHAAPSDRGLPYATFRELITNVPHGVPDDIVNQAHALGDLLDLGSTPDDPVVWAGHPRNVLGAAIALIRRLSERAPLITLWEDLHVADSDSVSLFMRVARQLTGSPVLFVGTLRPQRTAETSDLERLVEQFELDGRGALVDLGALDRSDIHALVANLIGAIPDSATVDLVFESSRGNPFFATETTRSLLAASTIVIDDGKGRLVEPHRLPRPRTALVHRFFLMGSPEAQVARVVSAFGRISLRHLPLVASIADITEDATVRSFDRLVAEGLLNRLSGDRFEFAHSILREALYDDIGPGEQRRIHSLIADDLSRERDRGLRVDITELATHVAECANPGDVHAAAVLAEAGRLTARTAPLVSARWFSKCAELQPIGSAERTTALMLQASSMFRASRPSEAARLGREALDNMPAGPLRTRTLTDTVNSLYICGDPEAAIGVIDTEERRFGQLSAALQAQRATFQAQLGRNVVAERDHAATVTNPSVVELAITMTHDMHRAGMRGDTATVTVLIERLKRLGPAASVQTQLAIHGSIAIEAVFLCLLDEAADVLDRASRLRQGDHGLSIGGQVEIAGLMLAFERGRWDESVARIPDLNWDLAHNQTRILEGCVQAVHCQILLERGELRDAREVASGFRWHIEAVRQLMDPVLGKLALAHGDVRSALTGLEAARCRVLDSGLHFGLDRILDTLIDACLADGDRASAVAHLVELDAQADRTGWTVSRLRADLARARVVFDVDAARAAKEAASVIGQPFEQARAALIAGQLNDDSLSNLTAAYETFDQLGALRWRQLAAGELRTRHLSVPRPTVDRHDELSETESMLTHLVSQGLTNRQIANTLHYSIKTVEVYLTRLYAKTNCRTRLELARAVDRGDVVTAR